MGDGAHGLAETYRRDGFVFPIEVLSEAEAGSIRADLEAAEAEVADDPERSALLRGSVNHLLPSFDALVRNENLLAAAAQVLGPDLLVWSAGLFIKEAHTPKVVTWHQDLTYWGLDDVEETTGWVALSPATVASGCMRFVPGSHRRRIVPHVDTFAADNQLSRGQEIAVEVDEDDGVAVELHTGQASLHHGHLFHASGPNSTDDPPHRRCHSLYQAHDAPADRRALDGQAGMRRGPLRTLRPRRSAARTPARGGLRALPARRRGPPRDAVRRRRPESQQPAHLTRRPEQQPICG